MMIPPLQTFEVRASSLSGLPDCELRWFARSFPALVKKAGYDLRSIRPTVAAPIGTACHAGGAFMLDRLMDTEEISRADVNMAKDRALFEFRRIFLETEAECDEVSPTRRDSETQIGRMVEAIAEHAATLKPIRVERRISGRVPGTRLILTGQPDNIDGLGGPICDTADSAIRDLKCGKALWYADPQLGAYAFLETAYGSTISEVWLDWCQRTPVKRFQPKVSPRKMDLNACKSSAWSILQEADRALRRWTDGSPEAGISAQCPDSFMANPSSRLCSARWCPAFGTPFCRHGGKV